MGALQPTLPSPVAIPEDYNLIVIDLQDCFFTIPLCSADCPQFAFSVPSTNFRQPYQRYRWKILPQGMKNSPTLSEICLYGPRPCLVAVSISIYNPLYG